MAMTIDDVPLRLSALRSIVLEMAKTVMKRQASQVLSEIFKIQGGNIEAPIETVRILRDPPEGTAKAGMKEQVKEIFDFAAQAAQDMKP